MKWREMRSAVQAKLHAQKQQCTKHDFWHCQCAGKVVGSVKDSRGNGEMEDHEIGGCARSLGASEHNFKALVACPLSGADFCRKYGG
jgi:hypothetical protein